MFFVVLLLYKAFATIQDQQHGFFPFLLSTNFRVTKLIFLESEEFFLCISFTIWAIVSGHSTGFMQFLFITWSAEQFNLHQGSCPSFSLQYQSSMSWVVNGLNWLYRTLWPRSLWLRYTPIFRYIKPKLHSPLSDDLHGYNQSIHPAVSPSYGYCFCCDKIIIIPFYHHIYKRKN